MSEHLLPNETLIQEARQHRIVFVRPVVLPIFALFVVIIAEWYFAEAISSHLQSGQEFVFVLVPLLVLGWLGYGLANSYALWAGRRLLLTDQRVILINGIINRSTKVIPLDRVQDIVTSQDAGGRSFNYGTVEIDAAGATGREVFTFIPYPEEFRDAIFLQREKLRSRESGI